MKDRKKPVVVEAFQFDGDLMNSKGDYYVPDWAVEAYMTGVLFVKDAGELYVKTLEGEMHVSVGDYVIQGVNGELYPCKPDIFKKTYNSCDTLCAAEPDDENIRTHNLLFGMAIEALKRGKKVARMGWNGKGMFLYYVPPGRYPARTEAAKTIAGNDGKVDYGAYLALKTVQGNVIPWLASQADVLANDWEIVE